LAKFSLAEEAETKRMERVPLQQTKHFRTVYAVRLSLLIVLAIALVLAIGIATLVVAGCTGVLETVRSDKTRS
jgi:hypothetical protein